MENQELLRKGVQCLIDDLGVVDAEKFLVAIRREEEFDYTEWQRGHFDGESLKSLNAAAAAWAEKREMAKD